MSRLDEFSVWTVGWLIGWLVGWVGGFVTILLMKEC